MLSCKHTALVAAQHMQSCLHRSAPTMLVQQVPCFHYCMTWPSQVKTNHISQHIPSQTACSKHSNLVVDMSPRDVRGTPRAFTHAVMLTSFSMHHAGPAGHFYYRTTQPSLAKTKHISQHIPSQLVRSKHSNIVVDV